MGQIHKGTEMDRTATQMKCRLPTLRKCRAISVPQDPCAFQNVLPLVLVTSVPLLCSPGSAAAHRSPLVFQPSPYEIHERDVSRFGSLKKFDFPEAL